MSNIRRGASGGTRRQRGNGGGTLPTAVPPTISAAKNDPIGFGHMQVLKTGRKKTCKSDDEIRTDDDDKEYGNEGQQPDAWRISTVPVGGSIGLAQREFPTLRKKKGSKPADDGGEKVDSGKSDSNESEKVDWADLVDEDEEAEEALVQEMLHVEEEFDKRVTKAPAYTDTTERDSWRGGSDRGVRPQPILPERNLDRNWRDRDDDSRPFRRPSNDYRNVDEPHRESMVPGNVTIVRRPRPPSPPPRARGPMAPTQPRTNRWTPPQAPPPPRRVRQFGDGAAWPGDDELVVPTDEVLDSVFGDLPSRVMISNASSLVVVDDIVRQPPKVMVYGVRGRGRGNPTMARGRSRGKWRKM